MPTWAQGKVLSGGTYVEGDHWPYRTGWHGDQLEHDTGETEYLDRYVAGVLKNSPHTPLWPSGSIRWAQELLQFSKLTTRLEQRCK